MGITPIRKSVRTVAAALLVGGLLLAAPIRASASVITQVGYGWDSCNDPTTSQMQTWWTYSDLIYYGVYIGGGDLGCQITHVNASWISTVLGQGWGLLPIWVGMQNPCAYKELDHFSLNTATAYQQGQQQASDALSAWMSLHSDSNVPLDADIEYDDGENDTSACRAAQQSYVEGWDEYLDTPPAQHPGVYTSSCAGYLDDLATISHPPNFIDAGNWTGITHTSSISCIPSTHWAHQQRHKQYLGPHSETHGGLKFTEVDDRCANTIVYETLPTIYDNTDCS